MLSGQSCFGTSLRPFTSAFHRRQVRKLSALGMMIGLSIFCSGTLGWPIITSGAPGCVSHKASRSEEHTSELQSLRHLVCRLLLEKKKQRDWKSAWLGAAVKPRDDLLASEVA